MNAPLTRRALLGATAAVGAVALPAAALSAAAPSRAMSPEASALLREFHDVAGRFNAACDSLDAAQAATADVPEPEALFVHGQDFWTLGCVVPKRRWKRGRLTYGFDQVVAQLRALPATQHDRKRAERRDEVVGAWDRWQADTASARDASGETAAVERYQQACAEHEAFLLRLVHLRTTDLNVMRIKAAAVLNIWSGDADRFDHAVDRVVKSVLERCGDAKDALCSSLMRDMLHGLGAEYRVLQAAGVEVRHA